MTGLTYVAFGQVDKGSSVQLALKRLVQCHLHNLPGQKQERKQESLVQNRNKQLANVVQVS